MVAALRSSRLHRPSVRGVTLIEVLVAVLVFSLAMLGLARLQARMVTGATDAQQRVIAAGLVDRLLSHALIDPANARCYEVPAAPPPGCTSAAASDTVALWRDDVADLPGSVATSTLITLPDGTHSGPDKQLKVRLTWLGAGRDEHAVEAITDVR